MVADLHTIGKEFYKKNVYRQDDITRNTTLEVLLYDDSSDELSESDDLDAITTEPDDGNYERLTVEMDSSNITIEKNSDGNYEAVIADRVFDLEDTTGTVDAYAIVATFESEEAGDSSAQKHIIYSDTLTTTETLDNITEATFTEGSIDID